MATFCYQYASFAASSKLAVPKVNSSFSGRSSPRLHTAWFSPNGLLLKRRANVTASSSEDSNSTDKNTPLWRKELASPSDPTGQDFIQNTLIEEDIARLQKKRALEKKIENYNRTGNISLEGEENPKSDGMAKSVIEKMLVADFFFILFILAWLLAGLVERSVLETTSLIDSWLPLWTSVFQPALGVFMAGAIVSAVSGYLNKSGSRGA